MWTRATVLSARLCRRSVTCRALFRLKFNCHIFRYYFLRVLSRCGFASSCGFLDTLYRNVLEKKCGIVFLEVSHPSIPLKSGLATVTTWQQLDDSSSRRGGSIISLLTLSRMLTLTALALTDRSWRLKVFYIGCALIGFLQQAISWSLSKSHPHASVRVVRSIKRRGGFGELSKKREQIADSWKMVKYQFCRSCR